LTSNTLEKIDSIPSLGIEASKFHRYSFGYTLLKKSFNYMFLLDKFTTTYAVNSVGPWFEPRSRSHKWQAKSSTWDKSSVLFSCPKSLHTNFTPVALILLRLYALLKHEKKIALYQQNNSHRN
jgi:hypothetical protein